MAASINLIRARITKLTAALAEAQAALAAAEANAKPVREAVNFQDGDTVTFEYGRKNKRVLTGVVLGTKPAEGKVAAQTKVRVGDGFDQEVFTIHPSWVTAVGAPADDATPDLFAEPAPGSDALAALTGVPVGIVAGLDLGDLAI